jgi:hypothetical protein
MKARWDALDYDKMAWKWLPFTTTDIELIHRGLANGTVPSVRCEREERGPSAVSRRFRRGS